MPVILPESAWDRWLDREDHDAAALATLLVPAPEDVLEAYPVSTLVSRADNDGPELVRRIDPDDPISRNSDSPGESGESTGDSAFRLFS
jgi:putative SOS response-associated peptidase YedK